MPSLVDLKPMLELLSQEVETVFGVLRDKGAKRFLRAFLVAGFLVFGSYAILYRPPQSKSDSLDAEIARAKTMNEYGEKYTDLRDQLTTVYARLPSVDDRDQWLSNSVRELMDAGKLETDDFKPMHETVRAGLIFQTSSVTLNVRFADFYGLLLRIENAKPLMHLQSADIGKTTDISNPANIGMAMTTCDIATVIPEKRLDR